MKSFAFPSGSLLANSPIHCSMTTCSAFSARACFAEDLFKDTSFDNLSALRSDFLDAYKAWQYVEMFNIGKAEEIYYNLKSNEHRLHKTNQKTNPTTYRR